jgi:hypothetical protein
MIYREQMWYSLEIASESRSASVVDRDRKTIRRKEWDNRNGTIGMRPKFIVIQQSTFDRKGNC